MSTWVVGDVHGCAHELEALLERIGPGTHDRVLALGDLFHRGPEPLAVARCLWRVGARFVLGNHEHALLARLGQAPASAAGRTAPWSFRERVFTPDELRGDAGRELRVEPAEVGELFELLAQGAGYFLESPTLEGAGPTPDGRPWCAVHAGVSPGRRARDSRREDLIYAARAGGRGAPFWYAGHAGPELVLFGHLVQPEPLRVEQGGRLVALGLDTGVLYGGRLTAYAPEEDRLVSVPARRAHVALPARRGAYSNRLL